MSGISCSSKLPGALTALALVALVGFAIGCGGGGTGGVGAASSTTPGVNSTSGASTSGSSTSGSSTSGKTTTGSTGTSTSSGTTSGSTTGSTTTAGTLPNNTIFFSDDTNSTVTLKDVAPNGSGLTTVGVMPSGIAAAVVNPNVAHGVVFAYASNGTSFGIYGNSSLTASAATQLVAPKYDAVSMIQLTPDNSKIVFVASLNGASGLYSVAATGGSPVYLASADSGALSPDGTTIVFSQSTAAGEAILTMPTSGGAKTALTDGTYFDIYPQFSKDGTKVVFSSNRSASGTSGPIGICFLTLSSKSLTYVSSDPASAYLGPSFNAGGTQISFVVENGSPQSSGICVCNADGTNPQLIYASDSVGQSTYWTGTNGRSLGESLPLFQRITIH